MSSDEILETARALAPTIAKYADRVEAERRLPAPLADALHDAGLFRMLLPRSLGGAELDPPTFVQVMEEVARADASTAWVLGQTAGCSMVAAYLEPAVAKAIFGPPRGVLAWGSGPQGSAVRVEGGYRLTGSWSYASGIREATWVGAHTFVVNVDGSPRRHADGGPVIRTLLFPIAQARVTDVWDVMGLRGTGSDTYEVADLFVPDAHSAARDDAAERREQGPLYCFSSGNLYASGFACVSLGFAFLIEGSDERRVGSEAEQEAADRLEMIVAPLELLRHRVQIAQPPLPRPAREDGLRAGGVEHERPDLTAFAAGE